MVVNYPDIVHTRPERRGRGEKDALLALLTFLGSMTGVIVLVSMVLLTLAQPSSWARINPYNSTHWWDMQLLRYFFYIMILGLLLSSLGIGINFKRLKRKYDRIRVNLVFMWISSVIGISLYLIYMNT